MENLTGRELIAHRAAGFLEDNTMVNLGIGMPTMVVNHIPEGISIMLQSENGFAGIGETPTEDNWDHYIVNAGGQPASIIPGGCCFDSCMSFGLIRGGHVSVAILGALEVAQNGDLANWIIPGKMVPGMGGGMDLTVGARTVIVVMEHCDKKGNPKILKECHLPLTAKNAVDYIVTEMCVLKHTDAGLELMELAPGVTVDDVVAKTEADLIIPDKIGSMI